MLFRNLVAAGAGALLSVTAVADITATYQLTDNHRMSISVRDERHVRMDVAPDTFLLLKGDKTYSVRKDGKRWVAMDMAEMKNLFGGDMGYEEDYDEADEGGDVSIRDTGRTETIAGYRGKVFEVVSDGEKDEVVMTDHKDLVGITRGMNRLSLQNMNNMGMADDLSPDLLEKMFPAGYAGMMRQGRDMVLVSVDKSNKGSGYFDLPPGTVMEKMPGMGAGGGNMGLPPDMNMEDMQKQMEEAMKQMQEQMKKR